MWMIAAPTIAMESMATALMAALPVTLCITMCGMAGDASDSAIHNAPKASTHLSFREALDRAAAPIIAVAIIVAASVTPKPWALTARSTEGRYMYF